MISELRFLLPLTGLWLLSGCNHAVQPTSATTSPQPETRCPEPRPEADELIACPMHYQPVCALHADDTRSTHANACSACANADIIGFDDGACA